MAEVKDNDNNNQIDPSLVLGTLIGEWISDAAHIEEHADHQYQSMIEIRQLLTPQDLQDIGRDRIESWMIDGLGERGRWELYEAARHTPKIQRDQEQIDICVKNGPRHSLKRKISRWVAFFYAEYYMVEPPDDDDDEYVPPSHTSSSSTTGTYSGPYVQSIPSDASTTASLLVRDQKCPLSEFGLLPPPESTSSSSVTLGDLGLVSEGTITGSSARLSSSRPTSSSHSHTSMSGTHSSDLKDPDSSSQSDTVLGKRPAGGNGSEGSQGSNNGGHDSKAARMGPPTGNGPSNRILAMKDFLSVYRESDFNPVMVMEMENLIHQCCDLLFAPDGPGDRDREWQLEIDHTIPGRDTRRLRVVIAQPDLMNIPFPRLDKQEMYPSMGVVPALPTGPNPFLARPPAPFDLDTSSLSTGAVAGSSSAQPSQSQSPPSSGSSSSGQVDNSPGSSSSHTA